MSIEVDFPDWLAALNRVGLAEKQRRSHEITLRWHLSFCRRSRTPVDAQSAREFIERAVTEKRPQAWQLEQWKGAIRWFLRAAKKQGTNLAVAAETPDAGPQIRKQTRHGSAIGSLV